MQTSSAQNVVTSVPATIGRTPKLGSANSGDQSLSVKNSLMPTSPKNSIVGPTQRDDDPDGHRHRHERAKEEKALDGLLSPARARRPQPATWDGLGERLCLSRHRPGYAPPVSEPRASVALVCCSVVMGTNCAWSARSTAFWR